MSLLKTGMEINIYTSNSIFIYDVTPMNITQRYIELLKKALINELYIENEVKNFYIIKSLAEKAPISNACLVDWENIDAEIIKILAEAKKIGATPMLYSSGPDGQPVPQPQYRNFLEFSSEI